jgi:hypothetical protein
MPTKTTNPAQKPVRKIIKKRRKKSEIYFGTPVQEAIIRYNESPNPAIRNRIYREHIAGLGLSLYLIIASCTGVPKYILLFLRLFLIIFLTGFCAGLVVLVGINFFSFKVI